MSGECHQSSNIVCKHARALLTTWVNLDERLPAGVTVSSAQADTEDASLTVENVSVLEENTDIVDGDCTVSLMANRAILVQLSGGTANTDGEESVVTVSWVQSDGDEDAVDCRLSIGGSSGS